MPCTSVSMHHVRRTICRNHVAAQAAGGAGEDRVCITSYCRIQPELIHEQMLVGHSVEPTRQIGAVVDLRVGPPFEKVVSQGLGPWRLIQASPEGVPPDPERPIGLLEEEAVTRE